ncbi:CDP-diacylglycerol--glycerol-3-phosphate 3-phosphatidyltransferase [Lacibacterium aquatile]|uniref:CDP-diacylglycerol--glycerol-3-phosphate 3-phosphatidyltransferase n=1 Tax=Lacibacterium aquatile TaxID=1168082 RepID=A0ABW5DUB1_9PROT
MTYSLANILTLSRIAAIPAVSVLLYVQGPVGAWSAWAVYAIACATDWLDGYVARNWGQDSEFGKFLDPIADKLLVAAVLLLLVAQNRIDGWAVISALVILCREIMVSGLREFLAKTAISVPVSRLAKWKTGIQMVALGVCIVGPFGPWGMPWVLIGEIGLGIAALLTLVTGWDYLRSGLKHMTREEAAAPTPSKPVGSVG